MDERIERLITRKLDGVITEDESLELDRALIRSPEYRRMFELSERVDELCSSALMEHVGMSTDDVLATQLNLSMRPARKHSHRHWWWLMPGAIAACVGWAMFVNDPSMIPVSGGQPGIDMADSGSNGGIDLTADGKMTQPITYRPGQDAPGARSGDIRQAGTGMPAVRRMRNSDLYGIVGGEDRIYLIEVDRVRTLKQSPTLAGARRAVQEF